MQELIELVVKALVEYPDEVIIKTGEEDNEVHITIHVAPSDMGKVIGRQGRIAKAIRTVAKAAGAREDKKVFVEISE